MKLFASVNDPEIVRILRAGGIGVLRTDTLYGIIGQADSQKAVERIYTLKHRDEAKSPIVLISQYNQIYDNVSGLIQVHLAGLWPGKVSVIIPSEQAPDWIQRGNGSVAYRLPADEPLRQLIDSTGPLAAPSANPEGEAPAMSVDEARAYFGESVDFYVDGGQVEDAAPSQLIRINDDETIERLR
jgi:L-threonylcarbamoyladenylate synthase